MLTLDDIRTLPKVDLHRHLEGAIRPKTAHELFRNNCGSYLDTSLGELLQHVQVTGDELDLFDFLNKIVAVTKCLKSKNDLTRITYEAVEDASNDNVVYLELRFSPHFIKELTGIPLEETIEAVLEGKKLGEESRPIQVELILIMPQYGGEQIGYETVALAKQYRSFGTRGIDVAGDIRELGLEAYIGVFEQAVDEGLGITIHAGEITPADTVKLAVERLHASRIGHGIRSIDDPDVIDLLITRDILLEVCLTSNMQTKTVPAIEKHPIRSLSDSGVKISINTDDPGISNNLLSDDYRLLQNFDMCTKEVLFELNQNAIQAAFTSTERRNSVASTLKKGY